MNRAVFLDRDGTVIVNKLYLVDPDGVELIEGASQALRALKDAGYLLIIVSNQSAIGRGMGTPAQVDATNARMVELFAREGVRIDDVVYCPHHPDDDCPCRKPRPGQLVDAAKKWDIDLSQSCMVGDNPTDMGAGINAGCRKNIFIGSAPERAGVTQVAAIGECPAAICPPG